MCMSDHILFYERRVKEAMRTQEQRFRKALDQATSAEERFLITLGFLGAKRG